VVQIRSVLKHIIFLLLFILVSVNINSQCSRTNYVFGHGEKVEYEAAYKWGVIWVLAGKATFEVQSSQYNNKPAWYFDSRGTSKPSFDWFFKVNDRFQTYSDSATLIPLWSDRTSYEGGYEVFENYVFNWQEKKVLSSVTTSDKPKRIDTLNLPFCITDLLSAIYYARNIDFSKYKINDKIPFWVWVCGKSYPLYIRYLGKETIELHNKTKYSCLKFSSKLVDGTIFRGGEDMFVWVTDDNNHLAIKIQARIIVGSIVLN
jgi:hypothetical protein